MLRSAVVPGVLAAALCTAGWLDAEGPEPVGDQFQVNTYTTESQDFPSVAASGDGDFVVVWQSYGSSGTDTEGYSIQGQRYDAAGNTAGGEFQVNTYTTGYQSYPSVAVEADGDFVVVWQSQGSGGTDTSGYSIQGQRYDAAGNTVGGEFQVNTYTTNSQRSASTAVDADGNFIVVWVSGGSSGSDTQGSSIQGQRYDAAGDPRGDEFQVNTYTTDFQDSPSVVASAAGDFVVAWQSDGSSGTDTSGQSIQGQRFDAVGNPIGGEFQVNTYTTSTQRRPSIAADDGSSFIVVWHSSGSSGTDTSGPSIQGQRFDAAGIPMGSEFQVNTYTTSTQDYPSAAVDHDGDFVVAWRSAGSNGTDTSGWSIQGQRFDVAGNADGGQFQINTYTTSYQHDAAVATDSDGNFVVAWTSVGSSGSDTGYSIQGQRYSGSQIFSDGFESGDTSTWSQTVP